MTALRVRFPKKHAGFRDDRVYAVHEVTADSVLLVSEKGEIRWVDIGDVEEVADVSRPLTEKQKR